MRSLFAIRIEVFGYVVSLEIVSPKDVAKRVIPAPPNPRRRKSKAVSGTAASETVQSVAPWSTEEQLTFDPSMPLGGVSAAISERGNQMA